MAKKSSGSDKGARKTSEKHKASKKSPTKSTFRKIARKPLKVADLNKIREAVEKGIALVWDNENALALRLEEVGRLAARALDQLDVLGNGVVKILKRIENLEQAGSADRKSKASSPDDVKKAAKGDLDGVRKAVKGDLDAHRKAVKKDLDDLRKEIGTLRLALEKGGGGGGGVTPDLLHDVLVEQIGAVNERLKALERDRPAGDALPLETIPEALAEQLSNVHARLEELECVDPAKAGLSERDARKLIEQTKPGIVESKLFAKFLGCTEMKDLLDERFNIIRDWLRKEEIPRQVRKITGR